MSPALQELENLPVSERVQLVEDLWDSIARSNADLPIPQWQKMNWNAADSIFCGTPRLDGRGMRSKEKSSNPGDHLSGTGPRGEDGHSINFHCSQDPSKWHSCLPS
jgi:hypothetical protein